MSVFSPYLATDAHPDTRSLGTILHWPALAGRQDEELAVAVWRWLIDRRIGTYHFLDPIEEPAEPLTAEPVKDPIRLLNSYGYMLCGSHGMVTASIFRQAGYPARVTGCTGHNVTEVFYDNEWHLVDVDMHAIHYKPQGQRVVIASCADLCASPNLVARPIKPTDPYYVPDRSPQRVAEGQYAPGFCRPWPAYWYQLHTLDFVLRPGETLTFHHQPQGRFHFPPALLPRLTQYYPNGWLGPKERFEPPRTYANACLRYRPALAAGLTAPGVSHRGLVGHDGGLRASQPDNALTIRVTSPYVIVGRTPDPTRPETKCDGAVVRLQASAEPNLSVAVPFWGGRLPCQARQEGQLWVADFTNAVDASYEYELTIRMPAGARIESLELETWLQVAPGALPMLSDGGSVVTLHCKDPFGQPTVPQIVDLLRAARHEKTLVVRGRLQDDPHLKLVGEQGVEVLGLLEPPDRGQLAWIKLWAAVQSDLPAQAPNKEVRLETAPRPDGPWTVLARQPIGVDHERCHFSVDAIARFDPPTQRCWVRLVSPNAVGGFRAALHYLPSGATTAETAPLTIAHRWREGSTERQHIERIDRPHDGYEYRVPTGQDPHCDTTSLSVAPAGQ